MNFITLEINIKNIKVSLTYSIQKLRLPKLGLSPPIILDLSNSRIMETIIVRPVDNDKILVILG